MKFMSRDTVLTVQQNAVAHTTKTAFRKKTTNFNPKLILKSLPTNATPAQLDSAIQANLPIREQIRSTRPDTLGIPGLKGKTPQVTFCVSSYQPQEDFFMGNSFFHPEINGDYLGKNADALPYLLRKDDGVSGSLLICFFLLLIVISKGRHYFEQQIKDFFFSSREHASLFSIETRREVHYTLYLLFQTCLILGLFIFDYNQNTFGLSTMTVTPFWLLVFHVLTCCIYFSLKYLIYFFINWIFFDKKKRDRWLFSYSVVLSLQGIFLFPLVLMIVYFNLLPNTIWISYIVLLILSKLVLFYKCFSIFFPKLYGFFHLIMYFCALEMMPMFAFWQALDLIGNYFIIKN